MHQRTGNRHGHGRHVRQGVLAIALGLGGAMTAFAANLYTVNSEADAVGPDVDCSRAGADCTLRDAVARAVAGDTIVFAPTVATIALQQPVVLAATGVDPVTVDGASRVTLSGRGANHILHTAAGTNTVLRGLTLREGGAPDLAV